MKKILITGSCGMSMSNFVRKIIYEANKDPIKYPYSIVSLDKVNTNSINSIYSNKNHSFHIADITNEHIINTIFQFEKPDIVIHGAEENNNDRISNSSINSNILGTQIIIKACTKYNIEKLIYISSDKVYGQLNNDIMSPWTENSIINPRSVYAASKASGELLVRAAEQSYGLMYNILRGCNNYGPRQTSNKLIPKVIQCITNNIKIPIYGQGLQIRDWLHVFDNCSAILTILDKGMPNEIYNIGADQEISNIELVQKICNIMNKGHQLMEFVPDTKHSHDFRRAMNCSKLKQLGWIPEIKLKNGLDSCILWYENNQWFLR